MENTEAGAKEPIFKVVVIPGTFLLTKVDENYSISHMQAGFDIPIDANLAKLLEAAYEQYHHEIARQEMRSFSYKWRRFWYRLRAWR